VVGFEKQEQLERWRAKWKLVSGYFNCLIPSTGHFCGYITPAKILRLYMPKSWLWCIFGRKMVRNAFHMIMRCQKLLTMPKSWLWCIFGRKHTIPLKMTHDTQIGDYTVWIPDCRRILIDQKELVKQFFSRLINIIVSFRISNRIQWFRASLINACVFLVWPSIRRRLYCGFTIVTDWFGVRVCFCCLMLNNIAFVQLLKPLLWRWCKCLLETQAVWCMLTLFTTAKKCIYFWVDARSLVRKCVTKKKTGASSFV